MAFASARPQPRCTGAALTAALAASWTHRSTQQPEAPPKLLLQLRRHRNLTQNCNRRCACPLVSGVADPQFATPEPTAPASTAIPTTTSKTASPHPFSPTDLQYMAQALDQAHAAAAAGEVPVGAVLVQGDRVLARAHNRVHTLRSPLAHAEMLCLAAGASKLRAWRLLGATLYVTLEPCPMCAGAIMQARLARVVYGARQPRLGADGSWVQLFPSGADGGAGDSSSGLDGDNSCSSISWSGSSGIDGSSSCGGSGRDSVVGKAVGGDDGGAPASSSVEDHSFVDGGASRGGRERGSGDGAARKFWTGKNVSPGAGTAKVAAEPPGTISPCSVLNVLQPRGGMAEEGGMPQIMGKVVAEHGPDPGSTSGAQRNCDDQAGGISAAGAPNQGPSGAAASGVPSRRGHAPWQASREEGSPYARRDARGARAEPLRPLQPHPFHDSLEVQGGCLSDECAEVIKVFFRRRRQEGRLDMRIGGGQREQSGA